MAYTCTCDLAIKHVAVLYKHSIYLCKSKANNKHERNHKNFL